MFNIKRYNKLKNDYLQEIKKAKFDEKDLSEINPIALMTYMDDNDMRMPKPKYVYDSEDITTHKYFRVGTIIKGTNHCTHVLNPLFKYGHL
jgi:hypothetical protein